MAPVPAVMSWSGGKDSSLALQTVLKSGALQIVGLLTTVTAEYDRISMHGVRSELLRSQAGALGLPLYPVTIPADCSNAVYEAALQARLLELRTQGVNDVVFGDLFLQDIRAYREHQMHELGMTAHFPIWGRNTAGLAAEFIDAGFRALIVSVDAKQLDPSFCGRDFDRKLLAALPLSCDPCGERGEFHTFVHNAPLFRSPLRIQRGEIVRRDGFVFCDVLPAYCRGRTATLFMGA